MGRWCLEGESTGVYKIELHVHTRYASACGKLDAKELIAGYKAAGYDAIVVTDHYERNNFRRIGIDAADASANRIEAFLKGYYMLRAEGEKYGIRVYKGAEVTFEENGNHYLLFGWEDRLLADPERVFKMGIKEFSPIARGEGALLVQAHPFRSGSTPAFPEYLDGVEVRNAHPRHDDHGAVAKAFAKEFNLIETAGSDCHRTEDIGRAGILSDELPCDSMALAQLLRSRNYELFG